MWLSFLAGFSISAAGVDLIDINPVCNFQKNLISLLKMETLIFKAHDEQNSRTKHSPKTYIPVNRLFDPDKILLKI
jgi:hypothetical protein